MTEEPVGDGLTPEEREFRAACRMFIQPTKVVSLYSGLARRARAIGTDSARLDLLLVSADWSMSDEVWVEQGNEVLALIESQVNKGISVDAPMVSSYLMNHYVTYLEVAGRYDEAAEVLAITNRLLGSTSPVLSERLAIEMGFVLIIAGYDNYGALFSADGSLRLYDRVGDRPFSTDEIIALIVGADGLDWAGARSMLLKICDLISDTPVPGDIGQRIRMYGILARFYAKAGRAESAYRSWDLAASQVYVNHPWAQHVDMKLVLARNAMLRLQSRSGDVVSNTNSALERIPHFGARLELVLDYVPDLLALGRPAEVLERCREFEYRDLQVTYRWRLARCRAEAHLALDELRRSAAELRSWRTNRRNAARRPAVADTFGMSDDSLEMRRAEAGRRRLVAGQASYATASGELMGELAHDLRTPLASLMLSPREGPGLDAITRSIEAMRHLVDDLPRRIETLIGSDGPPSEPTDIGDSEEFPLAPLIDELVYVMAHHAESKGIELSFTSEPGLDCLGRRDEVSRAVQNILSNAIKYSDVGGSVSVNAYSSGARELTIGVIDSGPGIEPDELMRLFERGALLSAEPTAGESRSGRGLHIARSLVIANGGDISVGPGPGGRGSVFRIRLPRRKPLGPRPYRAVSDEALRAHGLNDREIELRHALTRLTETTYYQWDFIIGERLEALCRELGPVDNDLLQLDLSMLSLRVRFTALGADGVGEAITSVIEHLERVRAATPHLIDPALEWQFWDDVAEISELVGSHDRAGKALEQGLESAKRSGSHMLVVRAMVHVAFYLNAIGEGADAVRLALAVWDEVRSGVEPDEEMFTVMAARVADVLSWSGEYELAAEVSTETVRRLLPSAVNGRLSYEMLSSSLIALGLLPEARRSLRAALMFPLNQAATVPRLKGRVRSASFHQAEGHHQMALDILDSAMADCDERLGSLRLEVAIDRADSLLALGRHQEVIDGFGDQSSSVVAMHGVRLETQRAAALMEEGRLGEAAEALVAWRRHRSGRFVGRASWWGLELPHDPRAMADAWFRVGELRGAIAARRWANASSTTQLVKSIREGIRDLSTNREQAGDIVVEIDAAISDTNIRTIMPAGLGSPQRGDEEETELEPVVLDLAQRLRPAFDTKSVELELKLVAGLVVRIASRALTEILIELLENALSATSPGGVISLVGLPVGSEEVLVHVVDTGPGLPDDEMDRVFEPDWPGTGSSVESGMSDGLYVARTLARTYGGELSSRHDPERPRGTFTLRLATPVSTRSTARRVGAQRSWLSGAYRPTDDR